MILSIPFAIVTACFVFLAITDFQTSSIKKSQGRVISSAVLMVWFFTTLFFVSGTWLIVLNIFLGFMWTAITLYEYGFLRKLTQQGNKNG